MPDKLDSIAARLKAATPGPWEVQDDTYGVRRFWATEPVYGETVDVATTQGDGSLSSEQQLANANLISHAPTDLAWACDEIKRLRVRLKAAESVCEAVECWKQALEWAKNNPAKMLSSHMTSEEASEVMREYFDKEKGLMDALTTWREARG